MEWHGESGKLNTMEDYLQQLARSWRSVTSRTVREAVAVLLLLIVVFGSGFTALTTYADLVLFDEDRFTEEFAGIFDNEDVQKLVAESFTATAIEMAAPPVTPAGSAGLRQTIQQEVPPVVAALLADEANNRLLTQAVRQAHRGVMAVEGGAPVAGSPVRRVQVDLGPIFDQMLEQVTANEELAFLGTAATPAGAGVMTVLERSEPGDRFWEFLGQLQDRRSSTISLILLCGIASLLISPSRTRVVWSIGAGIVAMAGVLGVGVYGSRALLAVLIDDSDTVRVAQAIHEALLSDLSGRLLDMALIGVLMIVIGAALGWVWRRFGPTPPEEQALHR